MKTKFLIIALVLSFSYVPAQTKMTLEMKDGSTKEGYIIMKDKFLKFKSDKTSKYEKIRFKEIEKAIISNKRKTYTTYFLTGENGKSFPAELVQAGPKINIYKGIVKYSNIFGHVEQAEAYCFKRENEEFVPVLGGGRVWDSFEKDCAEYFKDCPKLVEKISNDERGFRKTDLKNIAEFYNSQCD